MTYARARKPLRVLMYSLWAVALVLFLSQFVFEYKSHWWGVLAVIAAGINVVDVFRPGRPSESSQSDEEKD
ncbi:hypothetical protein C8E83_3092 [Frondihabitans australicus]|uniref:Uncharacterized protein n=2 Tax=Frondihabitans australicus TaxID=386892 RepID=A0A495IKG7_9MICO|nr:hypothetical protein C8E83_3092 [Frondihabitans australicus]